MKSETLLLVVAIFAKMCEGLFLYELMTVHMYILIKEKCDGHTVWMGVCGRQWHCLFIGT